MVDTRSLDCLPILIRIAADQFSATDLLMLREAQELLLLGGERLAQIDSQNAVEWANTLSDRLRNGSRDLGEIILSTGEAMDENHHDVAVAILEKYIALSTTPAFYREIAARRLEGASKGR